MAVRAIVRDADQFNGRWRFDGTTIFIDELHRDYHRAGEAIRLPYQKLGLSHEEIDVALRFEFPDVVPPMVGIEFAGFTVHCACGVVRQTTAAAPNFLADPCVCGRIWQIPIADISPVLAAVRPLTGNGSRS